MTSQEREIPITTLASVSIGGNSSVVWKEHTLTDMPLG